MAMTMQDIKEYVARTVNNTNPNQLESMINAYVESSGGGGGGDDNPLKIVNFTLVNETTKEFTLQLPMTNSAEIAALQGMDILGSRTYEIKAIICGNAGLGTIIPVDDSIPYLYTPGGSVSINGNGEPATVTGQVDLAIGNNNTLTISYNN